MRNKKRIPIALNLLFKNKILYDFLGIKESGWAKKLHENWDLIEKKWKENPDQRFGQLLVNLNLINSKEIENRIWYVEEDDWLIENNYIKLEDIKFWGINFYKNGRQRKNIKHVLLRDLKTDHIKNIIRFFEGRIHRLNQKYLQYFNERINANE